ncbi:MAG: hypothetical protein KME14_00150 [Tildeniella torsiva UHER 1998/13D]|nr:hypothetical protein [Tildeniella torsiva UHER 1998/13D]
MQDLAAASAETIESLFRETGQSITRSKAADWITQAKHLAESMDSALGSNVPPEDTHRPLQISLAADAKSLENLPPNAVVAEPVEVAKDESETQLEQPGVTASTAELIKLRVCKIILIQPPNAGVPQMATERDRSLPSPVLAEQPFQLNVVFELDRLASLAILPQASYSLQGFAKSLTYPHRAIALGESVLHFLAGHHSPYSATIVGSGLPSGLYRLQLLIAFQGISIPFGMHEIPRFQVV